MTFHRGERELQKRAGVEDLAARVGRILRDTIPQNAAPFLGVQRWLLVGARDAAGRVQASVLTGPEGFVRAVDPATVEIDAPVAPVGKVGLLAIDFEHRLRMRVNGTAEARPAGFRVRVSEAYSNCPKYIRRRVVVGEGSAIAAPASGVALSPEQQRLVRSADTFFIATVPPDANADVSHRGGAPGFVRVVSPERLEWDDYPGNAMFNTLGNSLLDPEAGLLFVDFSSGRTLQLNGRVRVIGDEQRRIEFDVDRVIDDPAGHALRWRSLD